jgi:aldose 1-epimerase
LLAPTGRQLEIRHGPLSAVVVELGAGLRSYRVAGREVLDGYPADAPITGSRGLPLLPWPNRVEDGRYTFGGEELQLPIDDLAAHSAIHGLTRWVPWTVVEHAPSRVGLGTTIYPRPGYPFTLSVRVTYALSEEGLRVELAATNEGSRAAPYGAGHHPYLAVASGGVDDARLHVPSARGPTFGARTLPEPDRDLGGTPLDFREPRRIGDLELAVCYSDLTRDADGRARVRLDGTTLWLDETFAFVLLFTGESLPVPSERRRGLAVEPMTCPANAFRTGVGLTVLAPGQSTVSRWGIEP